MKRKVKKTGITTSSKRGGLRIKPQTKSLLIGLSYAAAFGLGMYLMAK
jgi:hypothetical protein